MQVTVKTLDSETRVFTVSEEATVEEFKNQIAADVGIPAERQRLIFKGKVLQDTLKLSSYGVDECVVHLVERRPPSSRTNPDGESASRGAQQSTGQAGDGFAGGFNIPTDVVNFSQQIVQGLVHQLGLDSAHANVSTSHSGDGSTLNLHINLLASVNGANDAGSRIGRARNFLRAARTSLNRTEGEGVLPDVPLSSSTGNSQNEQGTDSSTDQQQSSQENQPQNPDVLADVLGELQEMNITMRPMLERYSTLLNANSSENLLPSDDSLPDRIAETLHNLSHAYHALSDLTFNFRSPEPRHLNVLPPLSNHVGASPMMSTMFPGVQPSASQPGQQTSSNGNGPNTRIHVVPGGSAIAFTSIISGSMPHPPGPHVHQHDAPATSGSTPGQQAFTFNFGAPGAPGNQATDANQRPPASSESTPSSTPSATLRTASGPDGVRIVMDDFVALFSNAGHPVTSHSETSRTSTTTPSQEHSQGDTQTQTQNSGNAGAARVIPRIGLGSLPMNSNHLDPLLPCESFHFGPRAQTPQGTQREGTQGPQNPGFAQSLSDVVASVIQGTRASQTGSGNAPSQGGTSTGQSAPVGPPTGDPIMQPLLDLFSTFQNNANQQFISQNSTSGTASAHGTLPGHQEAAGGQAIDLSFLQNMLMNTMTQASQGAAGPQQTINEFINNLPGGQEESTLIEGVLLNKLINRFGTSMSLQDLIFVMMGMPEPFTRLHSMFRDYLHIDLLNGREVTNHNIKRASIELALEIVNGLSDTLTSVPPKEDIDVKASLTSYLEHAIEIALKMVRDLDHSEFATQFPVHVRQLSTDTSILLMMCLRDGLQGAENMLNTRLPVSSLTDVNPLMLHTFQLTMVQNLRAAHAQRSQREDFLRPFVKTQGARDEDVDQTLADSSDGNSQNSDDSEAFTTPPASLSANDIDMDRQLLDQGEVSMELEDGEEDWKTIVPEDWVPIITRDVIRQRRIPPQAPFSDAYLSGLPPKRRKTADQRAMSATQDTIPSILRQAVLATGVTPRTSMDAVETDARASNDLHGAYREEVKKAVKTRTDRDTDYKQDRFPNTKNYLDKP